MNINRDMRRKLRTTFIINMKGLPNISNISLYWPAGIAVLKCSEVFQLSLSVPSTSIHVKVKHPNNWRQRTRLKGKECI